MKAPELNTPYPNGVIHLTYDTVVKRAFELEDDPKDLSEALALNSVFSQTTIPVPRVRRVVGNLIVMDYIPGRTLSEVWPSLSLFGRLHIAITLRRYIRQLRSICFPGQTTPGPLFSQINRVYVNHPSSVKFECIGDHSNLIKSYPRSSTIEPAWV